MRTRKYPREGSSTRLDPCFRPFVVLVLKPDQEVIRAITGATLKVGSIVELETLKVDSVFGGRKNA